MVWVGKVGDEERRSISHTGQTMQVLETDQLERISASLIRCSLYGSITLHSRGGHTESVNTPNHGVEPRCRWFDVSPAGSRLVLLVVYTVYNTGRAGCRSITGAVDSSRCCRAESCSSTYNKTYTSTWQTRKAVIGINRRQMYAVNAVKLPV